VVVRSERMIGQWIVGVVPAVGQFSIESRHCLVSPCPVAQQAYESIQRRFAQRAVLREGSAINEKAPSLECTRMNARRSSWSTASARSGATLNNWAAWRMVRRSGHEDHRRLLSLLDDRLAEPLLEPYFAETRAGGRNQRAFAELGPVCEERYECIFPLVDFAGNNNYQDFGGTVDGPGSGVTGCGLESLCSSVTRGSETSQQQKQKAQQAAALMSLDGGVDGTRTRGLRRDRPAF
jgi:hypothetical protein